MNIVHNGQIRFIGVFCCDIPQLFIYAGDDRVTQFIGNDFLHHALECFLLLLSRPVKRAAQYIFYDADIDIFGLVGGVQHMVYVRTSPRESWIDKPVCGDLCHDSVVNIFLFNGIVIFVVDQPVYANFYRTNCCHQKTVIVALIRV